MKFVKLLIVTVLLAGFVGCGEKNEKDTDLFSLKIENPKKHYTPNDDIIMEVLSLKGKKIDSVTYFLNDNRLESSGNTISLKNQKMGIRNLIAKVYSGSKEYETTLPITILAADKPKLYTYQIIESYPHDIKAYTQGLEFHEGILYESTGQYRQSSLRKTNYETGEVLEQVKLANHFFGEGLTIINNKIYQLTWRENTGFIYNLETLEQTGTFVYGKSKEGWGLCNDGKNIYKSDGTDKIWTLSANSLAEKDYIEIYTNTSKIASVNELEWVEGKIYANIYQQGAIAIINPESGAVEGVIDLTTLKDHVTQHPELDVLNGIAYKGEPNMLYITGKNWDKLFKIQVVEK